MKPPRIGQRLLTGLAGLLGVPKALPTLRAKEKKPDYWDESVTLTIDALLHMEEGKRTDLHIFSLEGFRAAIGPELWERYADNITLIADSSIARAIGKGNAYFQQGEDTWLMLMPTLPQEKAVERAEKITTDIGTKLVGAQFTEVEPPLPAAARISLADALNLDGSLNISAIRKAVATAQAAQDQNAPALSEQNTGKQSDANPARSGTAQGRTFHTGSSGSTSGTQEKPKGRRFATTTSRGVGADSARAADIRHSLKPGSAAANGDAADPDAAANGEADAPPPSEEPEQAKPDVERILFRPCWSNTTESIDTFIVYPVTSTREHALRVDTEAQLLGNAVEVLKRLTPIVQDISKSGLRAKVSLQLPLKLLAGPARDTVLSAMAQIPDPIRLLHVRIEVMDMPEVPNHSPLRTLHDILSPRCREVAYQLPSPHADGENLAKLPRSLVGIDLESPGFQGVAFADAARTLLALRADTAFLWGIGSRSGVRAAIKAGINEVGGPGLVKNVSRPAQTIPVPRSQFIS